jgi:hypothetical protein
MGSMIHIPKNAPPDDPTLASPLRVAYPVMRTIDVQVPEQRREARLLLDNSSRFDKDFRHGTEDSTNSRIERQ